MRGAPVVLLVAAAFAGCRPAPPRSGYVVDSAHGLRWSNSPVVLEARQPVLVAGALELSYSIVLDNGGVAAVDLLLSRSLARVGGEAGSASSQCRVLGTDHATDVRLPPGRRARVDCRLRLTPLGMSYLASGDSVLTLVIPAVQGRTALALGFPYQLKQGDVE